MVIKYHNNNNTKKKKKRNSSKKKHHSNDDKRNTLHTYYDIFVILIMIVVIIMLIQTIVLHDFNLIGKNDDTIYKDERNNKDFSHHQSSFTSLKRKLNIAMKKKFVNNNINIASKQPFNKKKCIDVGIRKHKDSSIIKKGNYYRIAKKSRDVKSCCFKCEGFRGGAVKA